MSRDEALIEYVAAEYESARKQALEALAKIEDDVRTVRQQLEAGSLVSTHINGTLLASRLGRYYATRDMKRLLEES